jgi:hypothetical protein
MQNCLRYVAAIPGEVMPRPLGTQLHATNLNEILHFDFHTLGCQEMGSIITYYFSNII